MATITSKGLVDDGSSNLTVGGETTVSSLKHATATVVGTGAATLPGPGYFQVAASGSGAVGYFTGSVPAAGPYPGSFLTITDTQGGWSWVLTGSQFAAQKACFVMPPGVTGQGTKMTLSAGASVSMVSDGYYWLIMAGTGSYTFAGQPSS